ncbi:MAG: hypothetical protein HYW48_03865 [Deltaproteobacteria bacterium]|nr:hypothetical protein [Deltaproteobacteria bacterium]
MERIFFEKKFPSTVIPRLDRGIQSGSLPRTSWIPRSSRGMTDSYKFVPKLIILNTIDKPQTLRTR